MWFSIYKSLGFLKAFKIDGFRDFYETGFFGDFGDFELLLPVFGPEPWLSPVLYVILYKPRQLPLVKFFGKIACLGLFNTIYAVFERLLRLNVTARSHYFSTFRGSMFWISSILPYKTSFEFSPLFWYTSLSLSKVYLKTFLSFLAVLQYLEKNVSFSGYFYGLTV